VIVKRRLGLQTMGNRSLFTMVLLVVLLASVSCSSKRDAGERVPWRQYDENPFVIHLDIPAPSDRAGGIVAVDLDDDGLMDYLVTVPGHIAAYRQDGSKLWVKKADLYVGETLEKMGLPGLHGPGVQAADIDGDGRTEVLYLTRNGDLNVIRGRTGRLKWKSTPPVPEGAIKWEHLVVADFRGEGDRDLLLQATNANGYRIGRYLAAYRLKDLRRSRFEALWVREDFEACAHTGATVADLDGDGREEVLGEMLLGPDGELLHKVEFGGKAHADYICAADIRPDAPGLEVVLLEEELRGRKRLGSVVMADKKGVVWHADHEEQEPQNAAVGEFSLESPGLEIWCRSRNNTDQEPFVFDAEGQMIASWKMTEVAPTNWTDRGLEVIWTIDWTGEARQVCAAKERHTSGDVAVFDAMTGEFLARFPETADRLYVADVSGDWREEIVVLNGNSLRIYHNDAINPRPDRPRLWPRRDYRRRKMTWNYYIP